MLTRLKVRNFRSLEEVDLPLDPLTAIVGSNGAGKTTILRALDLVLGDVWPSLRSFRIPQDFTGFDSTRDIDILAHFNPPYEHIDKLSRAYEITALRLTCKPYKRSGEWGAAGDLHVELEPLNEEGKIPVVAVTGPGKRQGPQFGPLKVGTALRDHARILFIDHRRSLVQHLPSARGSILGRLLHTARKEFDPDAGFNQAYEAALELLRTELVQRIEATVADTAKRMLGFLGRDIAQSVQIYFGFADPTNPFNSLRLQYRESGLTVPGDELGLGIQSAMVVGIFEAFRQLANNCGTIVIEEPEMYLHPQAQRYFFRLLCEMVEEGRCQVIYSTHSPIFADVSRFEALRLVKKGPDQRTRLSFVADKDRGGLEQARDGFKIGGKFDSAKSEVLFARRALLVEGYGDRIAALTVAEKLAFDPDAAGVAVVDCGGKAGIPLVVRVCRALDIPFLVLHDEDVWPTEDIKDERKREKQERENSEEIKKNERIRDAVGEAGELFVITPTLENCLGISRSALDKPRRIYEALLPMSLESVPHQLEPLIQAVRTLAAIGDAEEERDGVAAGMVVRP